ncbi:MAG TPA: hypothetical protein VKS21_05565 [Spirochaetota bacterium]|nr:hypothetical protein [Spirochaetota bacterium]
MQKPEKHTPNNHKITASSVYNIPDKFYPLIKESFSNIDIAKSGEIERGKKYDFILAFRWARNNFIDLLKLSKKNRNKTIYGEYSYYANTAILYYGIAYEYIYSILILKNHDRLLNLNKERYDFDINEGKQINGAFKNKFVNDLKIINPEAYKNFIELKGNVYVKEIIKQGYNVTKHKKVIKLEDTFAYKMPTIKTQKNHITYYYGTHDPEYTLAQIKNKLYHFNNLLVKYIVNKF